MITLAKVLRGFGWALIVLAVLLNISVYTMVIINQGFWTLVSELNPFNFRFYFTVGLTFLPGGLLFVLADAIRRRSARVPHSVERRGT